MKSMLKYLALFVACIQLQAVDVTTAVTGAGTNNIFTGGGRISQIVIANDAASALQVKFFDAPSTALTYSQGQYTNYVSYTTNIVSVYTTPSGILQTNTNSGTFTYKQTVAASTPSYRVVSTISVPASTTVTFVPTGGLLVANGLTVTNDTNVTFTTTYTPAR